MWVTRSVQLDLAVLLGLPETFTGIAYYDNTRTLPWKVAILGDPNNPFQYVNVTELAQRTALDAAPQLGPVAPTTMPGLPQPGPQPYTRITPGQMSILTGSGVVIPGPQASRCTFGSSFSVYNAGIAGVTITWDVGHSSVHSIAPSGTCSTWTLGDGGVWYLSSEAAL